MAITRAANVIRATANADTIPGLSIIVDIKYTPGATDSVTRLRAGSSTGNILWEGGGMEMCCQAKIRENQGIYVEMTGTASTILLYLK